MRLAYGGMGQIGLLAVSPRLSTTLDSHKKLYFKMFSLYSRVTPRTPFADSFPGWGPDPNWLLIRPSRAHSRVFPDRNYRVFSEVRAHYGLIMVWRWSDQRSIWSKKSDHRRFRAHFCLIRGQFRAQLDLIINVFKRNWVWSGTISSALFFSIFLLKDVGSAKRQPKSSFLIRDSSKVRWLWSEKKSPADSWGRSPLEEILINWRPRRFLWKAVLTHPLIQNYKLIGTLKKNLFSTVGFCFL